MTTYEKDVKRAVRKQIQQIEQNGDSGPAKARLASLRKALGKQIQEFPELWGTFLEDLPVPEYETREATPQETAVFTALTLYALHQQGHNPKTQSMNEAGVSVGQAAGKLAGSSEEQKERIRTKLKSLVASKNLTDLSQHLRQLIQLLKSQNIPLDYPQLAEDIYWYAFPKGKNQVQLKWARDFVRTVRNAKTEENTEEKESK